MYDKDGSGSIELPEMIEIIGTLYEMEGVPKVSNCMSSRNFILVFCLERTEICHLSPHFLLERTRRVTVPTRFSANLTAMGMESWMKMNLSRVVWTMVNL